MTKIISKLEEKPSEESLEEPIAQCPECKSSNLVRDHDRAELVCKSCGLVVEEGSLDLGPEWRAFDYDQRMRRSRVGAPLTYTIHDRGLCLPAGTQITLWNGSKKPIELITPGECVISLDLAQLRFKPGLVKHVWCSGEMQVYRMRTEHGREIEASGNHPFLSIQNGNLIWKPLDQLLQGDLIAVPGKLSLDIHPETFARIGLIEPEILWERIEHISPAGIEEVWDLELDLGNFVANDIVVHNSTLIDWKDKDSYGKLLESETKTQIYRLRKWQRRIRVSTAIERNLAFALSELDRIASALHLGKNLKEEAARIYRRAVESNLVRGRSIEAMAAAAVYTACRIHEIPCSLDEISNIARISKKDIGRAYRYMKRELNYQVKPVPAEHYVIRFCSQLGAKGDVIDKALEILREAQHWELDSGRGPAGTAAAAIYIACILCGDHRTQREIADAIGVTEVTIRNRYKELIEHLGDKFKELGEFIL